MDVIEPYTLKTPIDGPNGQITKLTFRDLEASDVIRHGYPMRIDPENGTMVMDAKVLRGIISELTSIPPPFIENMKGKDFVNVSGRVLTFLGV